MQYTRFEDFSKHDLAIRCKTFRFTDAIPQFLDHFGFNEMKATEDVQVREGGKNIRRRVIFEVEKCWREAGREKGERKRKKEKEGKNGGTEEKVEVNP